MIFKGPFQPRASYDSCSPVRCTIPGTDSNRSSGSQSQDLSLFLPLPLTWTRRGRRSFVQAACCLLQNTHRAFGLKNRKPLPSSVLSSRKSKILCNPKTNELFPLSCLPLHALKLAPRFSFNRTTSAMLWHEPMARLLYPHRESCEVCFTEANGIKVSYVSNLSARCV